MKGILVLGTIAGMAYAERTVPASFYIDSEAGSDTAAGTAESTAWKSMEKVNAVELIPGDRVLFRRGGLWRGQLIPQSGSNGAPILYGAYGGGNKPILQGSVARNRPEKWTEAAPGIWTTRKAEPQLLAPLADLTGSSWAIHSVAGAKVRLTREQEDGRAFVRIACEVAGKASDHIQLWGPVLTNAAPSVVFRARVRSTIPCDFANVSAVLNRFPYSRAFSETMGKKKIGSAWQTIDVTMIREKELDGAHLHINFGDILPAGVVFDIDPIGLWAAHLEPDASTPCDVGIVILNHGEKWGVKKWALADVKAPLDYWYDEDDTRIFLACEGNPAAKFSSVELALTRHIVNEGGKHDVVYDGLAVRYGASHGFAGHGTARIVIRNCDIYWIGGGLQYWKKRADGTRYPVRFGNGIEFWGNATGNLVERNRLWQIYDAALTNQGTKDDQINITYRDNVIWQAEYSFEYWNAGRTANILFEHNTCVDAGACWSHAQRPDPNGGHLMFYRNLATTTNFVVRNNIFAGSSEVCVRMDTDWRSGLTMENNLYHQGEKPVFRWLGKTHFAANEFARYQRELGMDTDSSFAAPQFVDPAARDYRLEPGSPGTTLGSGGGPVGAHFDLSKNPARNTGGQP